MKKKPIGEIRAFNRWYTDVIGLLDQHLLDSAWSLAEARLIYEIHAARHIQASQLIGMMHIDKSYLSRLLKKLEKEKIVFKKKSPGDGRAFLLSLTEKGEREFGMLNRTSDAQVGRLLAPLSEAQQDALVAHLQAVMDLLNVKSDSYE